MKKLLKAFEEARDTMFVFVIYLLLVLLIMSLGVVMAIKAPGFLKFAGALMMVGSLYLLSYYPTFKRKFNI